MSEGVDDGAGGPHIPFGRCVWDLGRLPLHAADEFVRIVEAGKAEVGEDDAGVGPMKGAVRIQDWQTEEDVGGLDVAVDYLRPRSSPVNFIRDTFHVPMMDESQGFSELEEGVPDEGFRHGKTPVVVVGDEVIEVAAVVVVQIELRGARGDDEALKLDDALVFGEGPFENFDFGEIRRFLPAILNHLHDHWRLGDRMIHEKNRSLPAEADVTNLSITSRECAWR